MSDGKRGNGERRMVHQNTGDSGFVTRRIAGETMIVPVSSRVGDLDAIYTLNDVGSRVWALLETPRSVEEIVAALCEEYDAPREQVTSDLVELLDELQANGLVRVAGTPGSQRGSRAGDATSGV
jgi:coenzyme PQQ synthesis protein D (PqqD)